MQASVTIDLNGEQVETLTVKPTELNSFFQKKCLDTLEMHMNFL